MKSFNRYQEQFRSFLIEFVRKNPKNRLRVVVAYNILFFSFVLIALVVMLTAYIIALMYGKLGFLSSQALQNITASAILATEISVGLFLVHLAFSILLNTFCPSSYAVDDCDQLFSFLKKEKAMAVNKDSSKNKEEH